MEQFIAALVFFSIALLGMWGALIFSKFKGESQEKCENEDSCLFKKLGLKKLHCDT